MRQVCEYLDINQIVTGGHNPRGNAICERVNQTLGAMIRKLSDLDYKDLKNFLPSFEFMINTTLSSATKCTPFEIAHGLPARTIAQARIEAQRVGRGAQLLQRDAGMIILKKEWIAPSLLPLNSRLEPMKHQQGMELRIGEMVIMLDYPESKDWYVAEISQVLHDRFTVNGYITREATLVGYRQASKKLRLEALKGVAFHRIW